MKQNACQAVNIARRKRVMRTYLHQEASKVHRVVHCAWPNVDEVDESFVKQELHRNV